MRGHCAELRQSTTTGWKKTSVFVTRTDQSAHAGAMNECGGDRSFLAETGGGWVPLPERSTPPGPTRLANETSRREAPGSFSTLAASISRDHFSASAERWFTPSGDAALPVRISCAGPRRPLN
jgi:hypothetical protein